MKYFRILALTGCVMTHGSALAQSEQPQAAPDEPQAFIVMGLADNDLLNLRATASPSGMLIARLPMGSLVYGLGCADVESNRWCKVASHENASIMGWAAERYLQPADAFDAPDIEPAEVEPAEE